MKWIKNALALLVFIILVCPAIQKLTHFIPERDLDGLFEPSPRPAFTLSALESGEYQERMTPHVERATGFHNTFVRIFNQFDFSLFSIPHAAGIIVGKNNILQADKHIEAWLGTDFIGKKYIDDKVERLKYLQDYLMEKKGILLLVIMAPGKGYYFPGSIPNRYLSLKRGITNNEYYSGELRKKGVNLIDFNRWFVSLKDTSHHLLYPTTGIHWSCYGAFLCADSLVRYLQVKLHREMRRFVVDSLVIEPGARKEDDDMDRVLNLLWKIPVPAMTYPVYHLESGRATRKPAALFISDSFYWTWLHTGIIQSSFRGDDMWYYDLDVFPAQNGKPASTVQIDLDSALNRQEVVIIMQTNAAAGNPGFGFIDRAYETYYPGRTPVKQIENTLRSDPATLDEMRKKAAEQHTRLDAFLQKNAIYLYNKELARQSKHRWL